MARKRTKSTVTNRDIVTFCAFWAMTIAAIMYIFSGVINFIINAFEAVKASKSAVVLSKIVSIGMFLGNIALIVAVALPAWRYVKGRSRSWKAVYWIALVVFALGVVLGMLGGIF